MQKLQTADTRHVTGREAEDRACAHLIGAGLVPLQRNWQRRVGEIDLVMRDPVTGTIVFVEVRYRSNERQGGGLASIDHRKRTRLHRAALAWLQRHGDDDTTARIDVVALTATHLDWLVNAIEFDD